ncbi:MAG: fluoride efflux transporter CrcB [bacterium]|nr:fluoride efflux transporter CrcB [bacterium]
MNQIIWIALGGALGAVLRYLTISGIAQLIPYEFPFGTLMVNILGCFILGAIFASYSGTPQFQESIRPFFIIGILGGFTTFSTYSMELVHLVKNQESIKALTYFFLSNLLGFAAAFLGLKWFSA